MTDKNNVIDFKKIQSQIGKLEEEQRNHEEVLSEVSQLTSKEKDELNENDYLMYVINGLIKTDKAIAGTLNETGQTLKALYGMVNLLQEQLTQANEHIGGLYEDIEKLEMGTGIYIDDVESDLEIEE